jgi:hypothetical protein
MRRLERGAAPHMERFISDLSVRANPQNGGIVLMLVNSSRRHSRYELETWGTPDPEPSWELPAHRSPTKVGTLAHTAVDMQAHPETYPLG